MGRHFVCTVAGELLVGLEGGLSSECSLVGEWVVGTISRFQRIGSVFRRCLLMIIQFIC